MAVQGHLQASTAAHGISFTGASGETTVRYTGLKAWDAMGRPLPTRLSAAARGLRLIVDADGASFPVTVDPVFVHEGQLFGRGDPTPPADAEFGSSVSISGDTVVVGSALDNTSGGLETGSAYVFVRSGATWTEQQRLLAPDGTTSDWFGSAVSVSGDTLVVGAPRDDFEKGSAYVFVRSGTTWTYQQKLLASDGAVNEDFGIAVSLSGDTAVVGAPFQFVARGAAYVFVRSGTLWTQQQKLLPSDGALVDNFGWAVAANADTLLVGARGHDTAGGGDAGSAYVFVRSGTAWTEQQELTASDGAAGDQFGYSVALEGDTAVVGARLDDNAGGFDAGAGYVFVRLGTAWAQEQKLVASDGASADQFGTSVSLSADTAVIGAAGDDLPSGGEAGSAYVFARSGTIWTLQQKLVASDGATGDNFGGSVAVSGNTVVAGARHGDTPVAADAGSAYVFFRSGVTWTEQQKLLASVSGAAFDLFGGSVAVAGSTAVVGAERDDTAGGMDAGSAYVFVRVAAGWTEQQKLVASDAAPGDNFGHVVSVSGDTLVVGASGADTAGGAEAGAAYVFVRSGTVWTEQQKLVASDGSPSDRFGSSVSVSADTVVIGAPNDDNISGTDAGSTYVFVRSGTVWTEQQKITASDGAVSDRFGSSVSISAETVVAGAPYNFNAGGIEAGAAYVFVRSGVTWTEQQKLLASDGAAFDHYGFSVSASGETAVAGAPDDDNVGGGDAGAAYVSARSGTVWTEQQKLRAPDGAASDHFGAAVSVSGDLAVAGAFFDDTPAGPEAGSAYVFARAGTSWTHLQKVVAPDGAPSDVFGSSVSVSGDTVVIGAPADDTAADGTDAGSAHVFRLQPSADVAVTKTDGQTTAVPGQSVTYTITVSNGGPDAVTGAVVTDLPPPVFLSPSWTCTASPGSSCTPSGSGPINDTVSLLAAGTATYTLVGTVDPAATGNLVNTATAVAPAGVSDPNPANNSATDIDTLTPQADLAVTKTATPDPVTVGHPLAYELIISNAGPSQATSVTLMDILPAGVTFVASAPGPPTCMLSGMTVACGLGALAGGGTATVTIDVTANAMGVLVNTAAVSGSGTDPDPANNSASAMTIVRGAKAELAHGSEAGHDLAAQPGALADLDVFLVSQKPYSSYEVAVDATSGDIGVGAGPLLQLIGADGTTVLQDSEPIGTGSSRSLRFRNTTAADVDDQTVRVRSAGGTTDCGADDVYRIRAYETTYSVPRFNNTGSQFTVLVLQNPAPYTISGDLYFQDTVGTLLATQAFSLATKATLVLNTASVPGANGVGGAITIAHDGRYGDLVGKTVALEPATGFSFDTPLVLRVR